MLVGLFIVLEAHLCVHCFELKVDGVLLAPDGPDCWNENSSKLNWIVFYKLQNFTLQGKGLIDGNGQKWWDLPCKPHKVMICCHFVLNSLHIVFESIKMTERMLFTLIGISI